MGKELVFLHIGSLMIFSGLFESLCIMAVREPLVEALEGHIVQKGYLHLTSIEGFIWYHTFLQFDLPRGSALLRSHVTFRQILMQCAFTTCNADICASKCACNI